MRLDDERGAPSSPANNKVSLALSDRNLLNGGFRSNFGAPAWVSLARRTDVDPKLPVDAERRNVMPTMVPSVHFRSAGSRVPAFKLDSQRRNNSHVKLGVSHHAAGRNVVSCKGPQRSTYLQRKNSPFPGQRFLASEDAPRRH